MSVKLSQYINTVELFEDKTINGAPKTEWIVKNKGNIRMDGNFHDGIFALSDSGIDFFGECDFDMVNAWITCVTKDHCAKAYHISRAILIYWLCALRWRADRIYAANNKIKLLECNQWPLSIRFILRANNMQIQ